MTRYLTILTFFIGMIYSCQAQENYSDLNIIEVYWDKDTIESVDYEFIVISRQDTLRPEISKKYFYSSLKLENPVTILLKINNKTLIIKNVDGYYLNGYSYTSIKVNPNAPDTCNKVFAIAECIIDNSIALQHQCNEFNEVFFTRFHCTGINNFGDFYLLWKQKKESREYWWKGNIKGGLPAQFERKK